MSLKQANLKCQKGMLRFSQKYLDHIESVKSKPLITAIHDKCCRNCPSATGTDPEVEDYLKLDRAKRLESCFPCAWRPVKLCRGYWDKMNSKQPQDVEVDSKHSLVENECC